MKTIKAFRTRTAKSADSILDDGMKTVTQIDDALNAHFTKTPSEMEAAFKEELEKNGLDSANVHLSASLPLTRHLLALGVSHLRTLESHIALSHPQMEDGNNFGVTVQMTVTKFMSETRERWTKILEKLPGYYGARADAVDKLGLPKTSASESKTESASRSTGGKDGDASTTETKTIKEEKTSNGCAVDVHRATHVVALDVQTYLELGDALADLRDTYATVLDNVEKNKEKLTAPKGSGGSGHSMGMY
uniref:Proteasome activator PA28 C-terminal domain-containing protein n=1 Tax=Odontella aurita TaxID=265563 RepID=A0A7S4M6A7_9STRA|mmetsp:Transcript_12185/g.35683  ORF Transcript_12185/g.35683 Transcript_12185/m.35683 type:complete len:248 (+) Transcript_12185:321-1064(+)